MQIILQKLDEILTHIDNNQKTERWMNIKEVAKITSLSMSTIRREVKKGSLNCSNITGKLLFKTSEIENWLNTKQGA